LSFIYEFVDSLFKFSVIKNCSCHENSKRRLDVLVFDQKVNAVIRTKKRASTVCDAPNIIKKNLRLLSR